MKKKLAGLLASLMVLAMGTTAFAAGSVSADDVKKAESVTSKTEGVVLTVPQEAAVYDNAKAEAAKLNQDADVLAVVDVDYVGTIVEGGVAVTLDVPGVKEGDNIVLLHQKSDGTWETIYPTKVVDGQITAIFTEFSPVAIVKLPPVSTTQVPSQNVENKAPAARTTSTPGTSPVTGSAASVLPVLAMLCAAGVIVCGKKVKFNA